MITVTPLNPRPSGQIERDGITKTVTDRYGYDA